MQESNSNWSNDGTGFPQRSPFAVYNSRPPITTPPQNLSRNHGPMTLGRVQESSQNLRRNISNVINGWSPLMHHARNAGTHGRTIMSWLRTNNHLEENRRSNVNMSESTVINFDSLNEPSSTNTEQNYPAHSNSEYCQVDFSSLESGSRNNNQNPASQIQESSISMTTGSSNNMNDNNSANNIPNSHTNQGGQAESQNVTPTTENQSLGKLLNKFEPFVTFLLMKAIYDHREGILIFLGLLATFTHANFVVKREIAKQNRRSLLSLGILFTNLFVCICFIYFVFRDQQLYKNLIFIPPYLPLVSIWDLFWLVGITDFVLKFITIQLKVGMTCFPAKFIPYSARGKWYLMLESTSQLYRGLVPIQPWLYYLMEAYQGPEKAVCFVSTVAYMVCKGSDLTPKVKLFIRAIWKLLQNASLGVRPNKEQLDSAGSQCPICHDDYSSPIVLNCRHIFCEGCVTTWFDREQTCPLCRARIADDPSWRDGATSFFTQLF